MLESQPLHRPIDLTEIVAAWPELPEHIKVENKALVQTHKHRLEYLSASMRAVRTFSGVSKGGCGWYHSYARIVDDTDIRISCLVGSAVSFSKRYFRPGDSQWRAIEASYGIELGPTETEDETNDSD